MAKNAKVRREQLEDTLVTEFGFQSDSWGNYKFAGGTNHYRIKTNKLSWRGEKKIGKTWVKRSGAYYMAEDSLPTLRDFINSVTK